MDLLYVPAVSGAVAALEAQFLLPGQRIQVPFVGQVDARLGMGVHVALSSLVGQAAADVILPKLAAGSLSAYKDEIEMVGGPALVGGASVALLRTAGNSIPMTQAFLIGASSNAAGQYVNAMMKPSTPST